VKKVHPWLRLVHNSESFRCFHDVAGLCGSKIKPNLFSTFHGLIEYRPKSADISTEFSKFADWNSRESMHCIFVYAQWGINHRINYKDAFGSICKYLQVLGDKCTDVFDVAACCKGILFDTQEFWMIESQGTTIMKVTKSKWAQEGSKESLLKFLTPTCDDWMLATESICKALNVSLDVSHNTNRQGHESALLGSGASGRVFKLTDGRALKVILSKDLATLKRERELTLRSLLNAITCRCQM
jgi:hypothetical protein